MLDPPPHASVGQIFNHLDIQNATAGNSEQKPVEVIKVVRLQVNMFYHAVGQANPHFWGAFMCPGRYLEAQPEFSSCGSEEEM